MIINGKNVTVLKMDVKQIGDEYVLSSIDSDNILVLNEIAFEIYNIVLNCDLKEITFEQIKNLLSQKFDLSDVNELNVLSDIEETIECFYDSRILIVV